MRRVIDRERESEKESKKTRRGIRRCDFSFVNEMSRDEWQLNLISSCKSNIDTLVWRSQRPPRDSAQVNRRLEMRRATPEWEWIGLVFVQANKGELKTTDPTGQSSERPRKPTQSEDSRHQQATSPATGKIAWEIAWIPHSRDTHLTDTHTLTLSF